MRSSIFLLSVMIASASAARLTASYDFVIVGGGTAGLLIALRLSEPDTNHTVAVIEAGGNPDELYPFYSTTPGLAGYGTGAAATETCPIDWNITTVPQRGLANRTLHYARGFSLGGSSVRNFNVYTRGSTSAYDLWESLGNPGWGWDSIYSYLKKSVALNAPDNVLRGENATVDINGVVEAYGRGEVQLGYPNEADPWSTWVREGMRAVGMNETEGFDEGTLSGFQWTAATIDRKMNRSSSFSATYAVLKERGNVELVTGALAKRLVFENDTARGVAYTVQGSAEELYVQAKNEVILSAGTFGTPQLLQASGIGPRELLAKHSIPVVYENPNVGQNLQDHGFVGITYRINMPSSTRLITSSAYLNVTLASYLLNQAGPLTNNLCDFLGFERYSLSDAVFPAGWPHVEYTVASGYMGNYSSPTYQPDDGYDYGTFMGVLVATKSRGSVNIVSNDTAVLPAVDVGLLTDPFDQQLAIQTFKRMREILQSPAMSAAYTDTTEYYPGPDVQTDAQILEFIRNNMMTIWHASSTCAMLPFESGGVVNSELKVYGVRGLRVVDGSVLPRLPPGHPTGTVYAVAEKAAAMILGEPGS